MRRRAGSCSSGMPSPLISRRSVGPDCRRDDGYRSPWQQMQILIRADLFCHSGRHVGRPEWFQRAYGGPSAVEVAMERQMSSQLVEWVSLGQERERERERGELGWALRTTWMPPEASRCRTLVRSVFYVIRRRAGWSAVRTQWITAADRCPWQRGPGGAEGAYFFYYSFLRLRYD